MNAALRQRGSAWSGLPPVLRRFLIVDLLLLALAGICETVSRFILHLGFPYNGPFLDQHFGDLLVLQERFTYLHTLRFFTDRHAALFMYPATDAIPYSFFFLFTPHQLAAYLAFAVVSFLLAAFLFGRALLRRGLSRGSTVLLVSIAALTSYPFWFVCKQANMEICVWVILSLGLFCFFKGRGYAAAALIGIAGAMKIYPFVYLGLLLGRRQYRQAIFAFLVAVAVTIPAQLFVYPHLMDSWRLTEHAVAQFRTIESLRILPETGFDHSLFGMIKRFIYPRPSILLLSRLLNVYLAVVAVGGIVLYFVRIRCLPVANQLLCLCIASILFTPTSFDYTLIHLYAPWAVLTLLAIRPENRARFTPGLAAAFVCLAILFVPETEVIVNLHNPFALGGQVKAITLIVLLIVGLRYPFPGTIRDIQTSSESPLDFAAPLMKAALIDMPSPKTGDHKSDAVES